MFGFRLSNCFRSLFLLSLFFSFSFSFSCAAKLVEEVLDVPVRAKNAFGMEVSQSIKVTIFRDDEKDRAPFLVLSHGRPANAAEFAAMGRMRFAANARYFVGKGFAVLVPTRIGYGVSGGEDIEYAGTCGARNYPASFGAAAQQVVRVVEHARALPYVDAEKGIVVGQSYGGATSIALAAEGLPGVVAAINFSGGGGGDPVGRPGRPCRPDLLEAAFSSYGQRARIPTLWLYSTNDKFFGDTYPRQWFDAFVGSGGEGEFIQLPPLLPPLGEDGHSTFVRNPAAWMPAVDAFLTRVGF